YTYDGAGNITKMVKPDETTLYTYNGANEITTACTDANTNGLCDSGENAVTYEYDAYGNLRNDGAFEYLYDGANRLAEVQQNGQTAASMVYNGDGDLIEVTLLGTTTQYVRDWASRSKPALVETTGTDKTYNLYGLQLE